MHFDVCCAKLHIIPGSVWYSVIHLDMTTIKVTPNLCTWQTQQRHQARALHKLWGPHQCQSIKVLRFYRIEGYLVQGGENRLYNLFIFERGLSSYYHTPPVKMIDWWQVGGTSGVGGTWCRRDFLYRRDFRCRRDFLYRDFLYKAGLPV